MKQLALRILIPLIAISVTSGIFLPLSVYGIMPSFLIAVTVLMITQGDLMDVLLYGFVLGGVKDFSTGSLFGVHALGVVSVSLVCMYLLNTFAWEKRSLATLLSLTALETILLNFWLNVVYFISAKLFKLSILFPPTKTVLQYLLEICMNILLVLVLAYIFDKLRILER